MAYKEQQIIYSAEQLGQRCGNVIMKEHAGNYWREKWQPSGNDLDDLAERVDWLHSELTEGYTAFTYSEKDEMWLVPEAICEPELVWGEPQVQKRVSSKEVEAWADNAAAKRPKAERAMLVAGPVLSFAGVEVATGSLIESGIAGMAAAGVTRVMSYLSRYERRTKHLNTLERNLHELGRATAEDETVRLPNKSEAQYLTPAQLEALKARTIEVASAHSTTVPAYDVLRWIGTKSFGHSTTQSSFHFSGYKHHLNTEGVVVELESSLWQLFKEGSRGDNVFIFDDEKIRTVKNFIGSREEIAKDAGLVLVPAEPPKVMRSANSEKLGVGAEAAAGWTDASCSLISLPPGQLLRDLLVHSNDPNKFWQLVLPELIDIQGQYQQLYGIQKDLRTIKSRAYATGIAADGDAERIADLQQQETVTRQYIFETTLSVAAAAMLQDRQQRYHEAREALLASVGRTSQAEDQWGAMVLFDRGITAVVTQLEPDSEEAIQTSKELVSYLSSTAKYIDGTQAVYDQVYAGMQKRFPQLQLP